MSGPPEDPPYDTEPAGSPEEIAAAREQMDAFQRRWPKGGPKPSPAEVKAYRQVLMRHARLKGPRGRLHADKPTFRLVKAISAERRAHRAIDEAARILEERMRNLRLAIGTYAQIARKDLPRRLTQHLNSDDKKLSMQAASLLTQIFIHITGAETVSAKARGGKARPGWPAEGAKS